MPRRNHSHLTLEEHNPRSIADGVMYFTGLMIQRAIKDLPYAKPGELPRVSFREIQRIERERQPGDGSPAGFSYSIEGLHRHIALKGQRTYTIQRMLSPDEIRSKEETGRYIDTDLQAVYDLLKERDPRLVWPEMHGSALTFIVLNPFDVMVGSTHRHARG